MSIRTFIQTQILLPRLQQHEVLVVYDAEQRYRELCLELASETLRVVDAGESSIESRAAALAAGPGALRALPIPEPGEALGRWRTGAEEGVGGVGNDEYGIRKRKKHDTSTRG
jgi:hypothetical protein